MWKIFTKEGIEILRYIPRIDFFRIPDHFVSSEFMEMKVTLEEGCAGPDLRGKIHLNHTTFRHKFKLSSLGYS